jgi:hypothetical protein
MYKTQRIKRKEVPARPKEPVFVSQRRNEERAAEKENVTDNPDIVPNSQTDPYEDVPASQNACQSQSRFASQRHQIRLTQAQQPRGKNYFEIALISTKIQITEIGKRY